MVLHHGRQIEIIDLFISTIRCGTGTTRHEFVLLDRKGEEVLNIDEPLQPTDARPRLTAVKVPSQATWIGYMPGGATAGA